METFDEYFARMTTKVPRPDLEKLIDPVGGSAGSRQNACGDLPVEEPAREAEIVLTVSCSIGEEDFSPTVGDVEHFIESFGFDSSDFRIRLMAESHDESIHSTAFLISGPRRIVQQLRVAHQANS